MRSPVRRVLLERLLRGAAFALLALCAWALLADRRTDGPADSDDAALGGDLRRWTRSASLDSSHVALRAAPPAFARDWLRALAAAGTWVSWSGPVPATAVEVVPVPDPAGGVRVLAAAPRGAAIRLADSLGVLDSAAVAGSGAAFLLPAHRGRLDLSAAGQRTVAPGADSLVPRAAVVLGRADWEARFTIAALEERGWTVETRLAVAPGIAVMQGRPLPLDTARHAVVIVLDSLSPSDAAGIARFVAAGGGAVLSAAAARSAPGIAAGAVAPHVRAPLVSFTSAAPRRALALDPVQPRSDATALAREGGHVVVAARRNGAGRVVQLGYDELWRWRLSPLESAADDHRSWWAGIVAAAAYRAEAVSPPRPPGDAAPLASLVAALGPARASGVSRSSTFDPRVILPVVAGLLFACLLAEWASRRLRGAA